MEKLKKFLICSSSINWSYVKSRLKKRGSCNWPELTTYCGCCTIPHGIYIRSVIAVIITILTLIPNSMFLEELLEAYNSIYSGNLTLIESRITGEFPDLSTILAVCRVFIAYYITWIALRAIYILFIIWTMYAFFLKRTRILKIILYLNVPLWFIEFFLSFVNLFFIGYDIKIVMIISHVSELYNILAIRSYYIKLRGKSRLVSDANLALPSTADANSVIISPYTSLASDKHCRTCTCAVRRNTLGSDTYITTQLTTPPNLVANGSTPIDSTSRVENVVPDGIEAPTLRPSNLDLDLPLGKVDLSEEPVIYDKAQLNIGSSPVLEDRCTVVYESI